MAAFAHCCPAGGGPGPQELLLLAGALLEGYAQQLNMLVRASQHLYSLVLGTGRYLATDNPQHKNMLSGCAHSRLTLIHQSSAAYASLCLAPTQLLLPAHPVLVPMCPLWQCLQHNSKHVSMLALS